MQFEPAGMGLGHREGQGIPGRVRALSHAAGEVFAPGFQRRRVQRIAAGADLQQDGVEVRAPGRVEQRTQLRLLGGDRQTAGRPPGEHQDGDRDGDGRGVAARATPARRSPARRNRNMGGDPANVDCGRPLGKDAEQALVPAGTGGELHACWPAQVPGTLGVPWLPRR